MCIVMCQLTVARDKQRSNGVGRCWVRARKGSRLLRGRGALRRLRVWVDGGCLGILEGQVLWAATWARMACMAFCAEAYCSPVNETAAARGHAEAVADPGERTCRW